MERVLSGDIRIPAFQREFVWEPDQVAFLIDSIYKGFPIGTIVFWQTDERLSTEKRLGEFNLPEPKRDYPVNYVLDGQQRLTSLFSAFQNTLKPTGNNWTNVYFDIENANSLQGSSFLALSEDEVNPDRHFPINTFFETVAYRAATKDLDDEKAKLVDEAQQRFKEYRIQNQTFETADTNEVAIVFERINRAGTELDVFELLAAWSWSDDFDLIEKFGVLQDRIADHEFEDLVNDRDLQLRICAAIITGETSPKKILDLQGDDIRGRFAEIEAGIVGAIDFLRRELNVSHYKMLPFPGILVPLSTFFATDKKDGVKYSNQQKNKLIEWFWRSVITRRFSAGVTERQAADIQDMLALRKNENHKFRFPRFEVKIDFQKDRFSTGTANSKALILMLVSRNPQSFLSGANIDVSKVLKGGSRHEFHHIFPKAYLEKKEFTRQEINSLANICFLTRHDNNEIKAQPPSKYFKSIASNSRIDVLSKALCLYSDRNLTYPEFLEERADRLTDLAYELCGISEE